MSRVGFALFGLGNMGKYSKKVFGLKVWVNRTVPKI
jgi:hypothetical protein